MTGVWRAATKLGVILAIILLAAGLQELRAQQRVQSASQAASENCLRSSFRVVVDVGHTADVPGAMSARGIPEYAAGIQQTGRALYLLGCGVSSSHFLV